MDLKDLIESNLTQTRENTGGSGQLVVRHRGFMKMKRLQHFCGELKEARMKLSLALMILTHMEV